MPDPSLSYHPPIPLELTEQEQADLLALLYAFEGEGRMVTAPIRLPTE